MVDLKVSWGFNTTHTSDCCGRYLPANDIMICVGGLRSALVITSGVCDVDFFVCLKFASAIENELTKIILIVSSFEGRSSVDSMLQFLPSHET